MCIHTVQLPFAAAVNCISYYCIVLFPDGKAAAAGGLAHCSQLRVHGDEVACGVHDRYSKTHLEQMACALNDDGVFVAQMGESPVQRPEGPAGNVEYTFKGEIVVRMAKQFAPHGTFLYTVYIPSYKGPWTYLVACKSAACVERWHANPAAINLAKRQRMAAGARASISFDGSSQIAIQQTPVAWQQLFCGHVKTNDTQQPASCQWLADASAEDGRFGAPAEAFVRGSRPKKPSPNRTRAVVAVATRPIAHDTELALYDAGAAITVAKSGFDALKAFASRYRLPEYQMLVGLLEQAGEFCPGIEGGQYYLSISSLVGLARRSRQRRRGATTAMNITADARALAGVAEWDPVRLRAARQHCTTIRAARDVAKGQSVFRGSAPRA